MTFCTACCWVNANIFSSFFVAYIFYVMEFYDLADSFLVLFFCLIWGSLIFYLTGSVKVIRKEHAWSVQLSTAVSDTGCHVLDYGECIRRQWDFKCIVIFMCSVCYPLCFSVLTLYLDNKRSFFSVAVVYQTNLSAVGTLGIRKLETEEI